MSIPSKTIALSAFLFLFAFCSPSTSVSQQVNTAEAFPYSTDSTHITVWNGHYYSPLFIKGVNLGVAIPGTHPGQLAVTGNHYRRWFQQIQEAGFNTIRVYTLHFPQFYDELAAFNRANPQHPLLVFHGVWLEEETVGYNHDLFTLTESYEQEIRENLQAVHGNVVIGQRSGKGYGAYTTDISQWVIGYIIGREIHAREVLFTNKTYPDITSFNGTYLSIQNTRATEAWVVERLDYLLRYEMENYKMQRPVTASSWPTLDPLSHPFENFSDEVSATIDLQNIDMSRAKAGFFVSYHAYPYYPNYISRHPDYQTYFDHLGQNSYLGYLTRLKKHYPRFPLIIAEFGGASSWGVAKYAQNGVHHGGYSEQKQGEVNIRLLKNIDQAGAGGGVQFSWMDEWFKRTWITDPFDYDINRRVLWHNVTGAEQNFGLLGFEHPNKEFDLWEVLPRGSRIDSILVKADFSYLQLRLKIPYHIAEKDTVWISLDTYDAALGESKLPNGKTVKNRAEFFLMITNYKAELYVTEAYNLYGIWHRTAEATQKYQSTVTNGAPWKLVRWKNDEPDEIVQDIGNLHVNRMNVPITSIDGVRLYKDRIDIRIPWSLINVTDPSQKTVMHDNRSTANVTETRTSEGLHLGIFYGGLQYETSKRYSWANWNQATNVVEYKKASYFVLKEQLPFIPGNPIAYGDSFVAEVDQRTHVSADSGLLINDRSFDGARMSAYADRVPRHGLLQLNQDGSFSYMPETGYTGHDNFSYRVRAGAHWSDSVRVNISVQGTPKGDGYVLLYPNPGDGNFTVKSSSVIDRIEVFSSMGIRLKTVPVSATSASISMAHSPMGMYFVRVYSGTEVQLKKIVIDR